MTVRATVRATVQNTVQNTKSAYVKFSASPVRKAFALGVYAVLAVTYAMAALRSTSWVNFLSFAGCCVLLVRAAAEFRDPAPADAYADVAYTLLLAAAAGGLALGERHRIAALNAVAYALLLWHVKAPGYALLAAYYAASAATGHGGALRAGAHAVVAGYYGVSAGFALVG